MKKITIEQLIPYLNKGYVACDKFGIWVWFSQQPKYIEVDGIWDCGSMSSKFKVISPSPFTIEKNKDYQNSLIKIL